MKAPLIALLLACVAPTCTAQETFKCKVNGSFVYQDRPCPGAARYSDAMPGKVVKTESAQPVVNQTDKAAPLSDLEKQKLKLEQDKEFINQRVKSRNDEREKDQASEQIQGCENEAAWITQQIGQLAAGAPTGTPLNAASAQGMMLDQQNRQTQIAALQAQASAKRAQCDQLRAAYNRRWLR